MLQSEAITPATNSLEGEEGVSSSVVSETEGWRVLLWRGSPLPFADELRIRIRRYKPQAAWPLANLDAAFRALGAHPDSRRRQQMTCTYVMHFIPLMPLTLPSDHDMGPLLALAFR